MTLPAVCIARPVATTLLTLAVALAGGVAYLLLPVAPMPQVDFPTVGVYVRMPGASPQTMASSVATPLERHLGQIADVTEMTSTSGLGSSRVVLQFGLDRDIDGAARDVQAGINAAFADLPSTLKTNPTYSKYNPAGVPILVLGLTSPTRTSGEIFDSVASIIAQKIAQVSGVGGVTVEGSSLPGVRVELNPGALYHYAIGLEDVRAALASANANSPKGEIDDGDHRYQIYANDQATHADQYRSLVIAYRNGRPVHLSDVAAVNDSVEDVRYEARIDDQKAVIINVFRQPGANIVETAQNVIALLPELKATLPGNVDMAIVQERLSSIRGALGEVKRTLLLSLALVVVVVFLFLKNVRATLIPSVVASVSIIGTFVAMYLLGYSLNILTLMALTISTGFVVDDAIVVLENVFHHAESGMSRVQAALQGAAEVGFTVLSMSLSLIAVFLPVLMMTGIVGRLLREFAVTLSVAILISLVVSLTTTPMLCATILSKTRRATPTDPTTRGLRRFYARTLAATLRHPTLTLVVLAAVIGLNIYLYVIVPKGFIPQQDTGMLGGSIVCDQSASFQKVEKILAELMTVVRDDPAVHKVWGFTGTNGGRPTNAATFYVSLKPLGEREPALDVINRLRPQLSKVTGTSVYLQVIQDVVVIGGRPTSAQYQYTVSSDNLQDLHTWTLRLTEALHQNPVITEVNSDLQDGALQTELSVDRNTAARLGLNAAEIDNTLYDAFGQRQVSTIYRPLNQYHVVMEMEPRYQQNPEVLNDVFVSTAGGTVSGTKATNFVAGTYSNSKTGAVLSVSQVASDAARNAASNALANTGRGVASAGAAVSTAAETMIPLAAVARIAPGKTPLTVNHQGHFASAVISFNLAAGKSLSDAVAVVEETELRIGMPINVHGGFAGTAQAFQKSLANQPFLILAACAAVYIVLGILYESFIHPITILSTLPSAGVGALITLISTKTEFSIIAMIGVLLLIGIVKKNAIMMIDFALVAQRQRGLSSQDAIFDACLRRFRPIMMTTTVAMLGALPLALGAGEGSELCRPLGIAVVGGLAVSQILTLYTTPVVYLCLDRLRIRHMSRSRLKVSGRMMSG